MTLFWWFNFDTISAVVWEQRKLKDVVVSFDDRRIPLKSTARSKGRFPYYGATGVIDYVADFLLDGEYVLLAEDGANIISRSKPVTYLTSGKFWVNNHAHVFQMKSGSNIFLKEMLEKLDYVKYNSGTAQPKLNADVVAKLSVNVANSNEQFAISQLFKSFSQSIASNQRQQKRPPPRFRETL
ncbi:type I restriction-modification system specificity subunit [Secundilactobacillus kimchicus JCM 15530]|uniref:Type I restriction-modification system specificity subunit n=1 Tax=Secundilactobacillus kimchicus JCM 15530 TaxID=1302272 RepID=A0A0R1HPX6_9LACO|nr:restriction endonuclease subunit S [Secundilactobacillus kimchicus]KRK48363.1 type I restriction-modification system specificity subunit [Secundilactobacillus kimchicus JCM 15530]